MAIFSQVIAVAWMGLGTWGFLSGDFTCLEAQGYMVMGLLTHIAALMWERRR